jgi:hypothetical protein
MISTRQKLGADYAALAEIVAAAEALAGHVKCGVSLPGRLVQLRSQVERECNRVGVDICARYVARKLAEREAAA